MACSTATELSGIVIATPSLKDSGVDYRQRSSSERKWGTVVELGIAVADCSDAFHTTKHHNSVLNMRTPTEYVNLPILAGQLK